MEGGMRLNAKNGAGSRSVLIFWIDPPTSCSLKMTLHTENVTCLNLGCSRAFFNAPRLRGLALLFEKMHVEDVDGFSLKDK